MLRLSLLFLSVLLLCACGVQHNAHLYNAVPLRGKEACITYGVASSPAVYGVGTYSPDSLNTMIHNYPIEKEGFASLPGAMRFGLGYGFAVGYDIATSIHTDLHPIGFDQMFPPMVQSYSQKLHIANSQALGKGYYVGISPAIYLTNGCRGISKRFRFKYRHRSTELPITLSKEIKEPINIVLSGTFRTAWDKFDGDISYPGREAFQYIDFPNQPENKAKRYAALVHANIRLSSKTELVMQYGQERVIGKDHSMKLPIYYCGLQHMLRPKQ